MTQLAAILYDPGFPIDSFMVSLAATPRRRGLRLGGVVQHNQAACETGCPAMALENLATGERFAISAPRGAQASGCVLDAAGLAAAGGAIRAGLERPVEMMVINKFGRQEMLGKGLRQEVAAALEAGLPVLLAVRRDLLPAWREFAGEDWTGLAPESSAVEAWALARPARAA